MLTFADIQIEDNIDSDSNNSLSGYILTEENGWTEGLLKDSQRNKKFLFGTFTRYKSLQLYSLDSNNPHEIFEFNASKSPILYTFYTGETFLIDDLSKQYVSPCKISSRLLEKDPRDGVDEEKEAFITSIKSWKDSNLKGKINEVYQEHLSNKDKLSSTTHIDTGSIR